MAEGVNDLDELDHRGRSITGADQASGRNSSESSVDAAVT